MPKRKLPRNAKRLPKGTTRADYDPEVLQEWQRDRWRQRKEVQRKRQRHLGVRDKTFALSKESRETLKDLSRTLGMSETKVITYLLEKTNVPSS